MTTATAQSLASLASVSPGLVTSGAGAGARAGSWEVREVSLKDIQDDRVVLSDIQTISIELKVATEKHLLRPFDVLLTARSTTVKAALVPPSLTRAVANSTLTVVRPSDPDLGPYLWWFFTSRYGRAQIEARMVGSTVMLLRSGALLDVEIPVPAPGQLRTIARLIETSELAYQSALAALQIRHELVRDRIIDDLVRAETSIRDDIGDIPRHSGTKRGQTAAINGDTDATH